MMTANSTYRFFQKLVNSGLSNKMSLGEEKNVRMLNRLLYISTFIMSFYGLVMLGIGAFLSGWICLIAVPLFLFSIWLIKVQNRAIAKLLFSTIILALVILFSILFGPGMASEYWTIVFGGISLLIFRQRINAFRMVIFSILSFLLIQYLHMLIPPLYVIDPEIKRYVFTSNIVFIFSTSFVISFILRYSTESFERIIEESNKILLDQNKELIDSINYAKRIQEAILPSDQTMASLSKNMFVLFEPKDIVSGDFYWIYPLKDRLLFAVVDGSGHGVSGALTSIISQSILMQCVEEYKKIEARDIFEKFRELIFKRKEAFNDSISEEIELGICCYEWETARLTYTGNGNYLYLINHVSNLNKSDEIINSEQDRYVMKEIRNNYQLKNTRDPDQIQLHLEATFRKDDTLYLTTDGFAHQFGGARYKKFKAARLKDLLMSVQHFNLPKQKRIITDVLNNWRGKYERTNDITILGFKI